MLEVVLEILAGLGTFFIGMKLLSAHLKEAAGDKVRRIAGRVARRPALTALLGLGAGAVTQSTNAVTAAAAGLATAEIITIRQAFPLIACANIGTSVLVFLAAVSLHEAILAATVFCGLLYFLDYDQSKRWRAPVGALFALILIISGLELVTDAARTLRTVPAIRDLVVSLSGSHLGAFAVGALLTPVVQTAKTVSAIVAALADGGVITPIDAMMAVVGANLTSAVNVAFMTSRISPTGRALAIYQAILKAIGTAIVLPLLIVLALWQPPALISYFVSHAAFSVAVVYLLTQSLAYAGALAFESRIDRLIQRIVGKAETDQLSKPRFISREALKEPATATILAFREHLASLARLPAHLDAVREGGAGETKDSLVLAMQTSSILKATDEFLQLLASETTDDALRTRVGSLQRLNSLAVSLQEQVQELATIVGADGDRDPEIAMRLSAMVESAHLLLETFIDFTQAPDGAGREMLGALTGDRADVMEGVRRAVMSAGGTSRAGQRELFDACLCFERLIWILKRYTLISDEPGSPYTVARVEEAAAD